MHAADSAGGEDPNAGLGGDADRPGDGRRAIAAIRQDGRQVAPARLEHAARAGEALQQRVVEPDLDSPAGQTDRGGNGAGGAHRLFQGARGFQVSRVGQAMGDHRRLECDDRAALVERGLDLRADVEEILHGL